MRLSYDQAEERAERVLIANEWLKRQAIQTSTLVAAAVFVQMEQGVRDLVTRLYPKDDPYRHLIATYVWEMRAIQQTRDAWGPEHPSYDEMGQ